MRIKLAPSEVFDRRGFFSPTTSELLNLGVSSTSSFLLRYPQAVLQLPLSKAIPVKRSPSAIRKLDDPVRSPISNGFLLGWTDRRPLREVGTWAGTVPMPLCVSGPSAGSRSHGGPVIGLVVLDLPC
jgi:hypothetical protein